LVYNADGVVGLLLGDKRSLPTDIPAAVQLGLRMLGQGTPACSLRGEDARALFTGVAAHTISRMPSFVAAGAGLMLATLAHTVGWPVPVGGSQAIANALIDDLREHGGVLHTESEVNAPPSGVVLYDTAPTALLDIYGDRLPSAYANYCGATPSTRRGEGRLRALRRDPLTDTAGHRGDISPRRHPRTDGARRTRDRRGPARGMADGAGRDALHRRPEPHRRAGPPAVLDLRARPGRLHGRPGGDHHRHHGAFRPGFSARVAGAASRPPA
jgi:hypothetical protein